MVNVLPRRPPKLTFVIVLRNPCANGSLLRLCTLVTATSCSSCRPSSTFWPSSVIPQATSTPSAGSSVGRSLR